MGMTAPAPLAQKTTLADIVRKIPARNRISPFTPTTTAPTSNGKTVFNLNDDTFRYDDANHSRRNDDYTALAKAAKMFSNKTFPTRTTLVIEGELNIDRYKVAGSADGPNMGNDIVFTNASNFQILGKNAKVLVKGDFFRTADTAKSQSLDKRATVFSSRTRQITPLYFIGCDHFSVSGIEFDGNVDRTQKAQDSNTRVLEGASSAIRTVGCRDFELRNLYVHHFSNDGITLGAGFTDQEVDGNGKVLHDIVDQDGTVENVVSANNARQGLTIGQAVKVEVRNCWFVMTGYTEGQYGSHAPAAGIDIEPNRGSASKITYYRRSMVNGQLKREKIDETLDTPGNARHTRTITVDKCVFWHNLGMAVVATPGTIVDKDSGRNVFTSNINLTNSELYEEERKSRGIVALVVDGARLEGNTIDASGEVFIGGRGTMVKGNTINTRSTGLTSRAPGGDVDIVDNVINRVSPMEPQESVPYISQSVTTFIGNRINYPAYQPLSYRLQNGQSVLTPVAVLMGISQFRDNSFHQPSGASGQRFLLKGTNVGANQTPAGAILDKTSIR
jgi:hypothetical protein